MENEKVYLIHEDDYIKHIDEKLELYAMLRQLIFHLRRVPDTSAYFRKVKEMANAYDIRSDELFDGWGIPGSYMVTGDPDELCELMENELIEPEDAGYYPDDGDCPCCDGERCCDYAERLEQEYAAENDKSEDEVFEYAEEADMSELLTVANDILSALERLTALIQSEFDYED